MTEPVWRLVIISLIEARSREDAEKIGAMLAEVGVPQKWPCRVFVEPLEEQNVERLGVVVYRTWTREDVLPTGDAP